MSVGSSSLQDPGVQESASSSREIRQPADRDQTRGHRPAAEHLPHAGSVSVHSFPSLTLFSNHFLMQGLCFLDISEQECRVTVWMNFLSFDSSVHFLFNSDLSVNSLSFTHPHFSLHSGYDTQTNPVWWGCGSIRFTQKIMSSRGLPLSHTVCQST